MKPETITSSSLPEHLIRMPAAKNWALWRCVGLRGAGFPARNVLQLGSTALATAADALTQSQAAYQQAYQDALDQVNQALDSLRQDGRWEQADQREPLINALRAIKQNKLPAPNPGPAIEAAVAQWQQAQARVTAAQANYDQSYQAELARQSETIQQVLRSDRFCEAIIWQNRQAFAASVVPLRQKPEAMKAKKRRQIEELIARYVQRYSVKNDTIGFFGPVGWANLVDGDSSLCLKPGRELLASRSVYFEHWGIDSLIELLNKNEALRPWMVPLRSPTFYQENGTIHRPFRLPTTLPAGLAALLPLCDGTRTAEQIAAGLLPEAAGLFSDAAGVYAGLSELQRRKLIIWGFDIPLCRYPEQALRQKLEQIGPPALRQAALEPLEALEAARQLVAGAAGHPEQLNRALSHLETTFTNLTEVIATRAPGLTYGARTLLYEDCRRNVQVDIGTAFLEELGRPLSLLMDSIRWFTYQVSVQMLKICEQIYEELQKQSPGKAIDLTVFGATFQPAMVGSLAFTDQVMADYYERWEQILAIAPGERRAVFHSESLRPQVEAVFNAPEAGWVYARYQCPDVMVAAPDAAAIQQGNYQLILGEIHVALNTLAASLWVGQHPEPEQFFRATDSDMPDIRLISAPRKNWPKVTARTRRECVPSQAIQLVFGNEPSELPPTQVIPIGSLVIDRVDGQLRICSRDGKLQFDLIEALSEILSYFALKKVSFGIASSGKNHSPRITIDKLVIARETWSFEPEAFDFAFSKSDQERFAGARRWAQAQGIPRFVFVRVPTETKPFYLDFDSPIYINIFAKAVRLTAESNFTSKRITLAEMLPAPDQTWLADAAGEHYTSELRFIALDVS